MIQVIFDIVYGIFYGVWTLFRFLLPYTLFWLVVLLLDVIFAGGSFVKTYMSKMNLKGRKK